MKRRTRFEYLICTLSVATTSFLIYGLIGFASAAIEGNKWLSLVLFGFLGGYGFSAIVSAIYLAVGFFKKRGLVFKIIASVFWPITFAACVYVGYFTYIPYQIYNFIKILTYKEPEKDQPTLTSVNEN